MRNKEYMKEKVIYIEEPGHTCRPIKRAGALNPPRRIKFSCAESNRGGADTRPMITGRPQH